MTVNSPAAQARTVELTRESVELFKILKFEGLFDSGGAAKAAIAAGAVAVNGAVERRKRRQICAGDFIECNQQQLQISGLPQDGEDAAARS